jgi:threonine/homoserine/homoserine lactone efflux protein
MVFLSLVFMGMTLGVFMLYGISANGVRRYVVNSPKVFRRFQRIFAFIFVGLGAKLVFTD